MGGWDFSIFWLAGQAILHGQSPYSVENFFSPLLFAYGFVPLALLPQQVAFFLWLFINLVILIVCLRRPFWKWLLYLPMIHLFSSGQVELLWWAMERAINRGWRGAILGALMTLKPQAAVILLSWHLLDWLRNDRRTLVRWLVLTVLLWGIPTLLSPSWLGDWRANLPTSTWQESAGNAPGIFSLLRLAPGIWPILLVIAAAIFIWGQFQSKPIARAAAMLASPVGLFYSTLALVDTAPAWLLVPASIIATILSMLTNTFIGFAALPVIVIIWHRYHPQPELPKKIEVTAAA